jgi:hypothetical protein
VRTHAGLFVIAACTLAAACAPPELKVGNDRDAGAGGSVAPMNGGGALGSGAALGAGGHALGGTGPQLFGGALNGGNPGAGGAFSGGSGNGAVHAGGANSGGIANGGVSGGGLGNGGTRDAGSGSGGLDSGGGDFCDPQLCGPNGDACCEGQCVFTRIDPVNCGHCGTRCSRTEVCTDSQCQPVVCEAPAYQQLPLTDGGNPCQANEVCCYGQCCGPTQRCCDEGAGTFVCEGAFCLPP